MNQVHFFQSTQTGASAITGQAGSLISVLNACLLTGFNLVGVSDITRVDDVATASAPTGHGYRDGDTIKIDGAAVADYNGNWRIKNCTTTTFDFDIAGAPATPAGGTISARVAPLGWESPFTGDNKAAYRSLDESSNKMYLRINETSIPGGTAGNGYLTASALAQMCEAMTDIDTTTGMSQTYWRKSSDASSAGRPWIIVGDGKRFWLFVAWSAALASSYSVYFFGDPVPFRPGDAYASILAGYIQLGSTVVYGSINSDWDMGIASSAVSATGIAAARSYSQVGAAVNVSFTAGGLSGSSTSSGSSSIPFPNPADNGIFIMPVMAWDRSPPALRSRMPGFYFPLHSILADPPTVYDGFLIDGQTKKILAIRSVQSSGSQVCIDIIGPWE